MEEVIKSFLGTFFLFAMVFLGFGVNAASMNAAKAQKFTADCISKIEESHYADAVVSVCEEEAKKQGYTLAVELYGPEGENEVTYGKLKLEYPFAIPLLNLEQTHCLQADIR